MLDEPMGLIGGKAEGDCCSSESEDLDDPIASKVRITKRDKTDGPLRSDYTAFVHSAT